MPTSAPPPAPLRLLLVDDEPLARLRLRTLLADLAAEAAAGAAVPAVGEVAEAGDAASAQAALRGGARFDAVLLDIGLPGQDGLAFAQMLKPQLQALAQPPAIVFVTAHAEHALAAFELNAADYLTKPVRLARLREALQRVAQRRAALPALPVADAAGARPMLVVSERGRVLHLPHDEILVLKAEQKSVVLRTALASYGLEESLTDLEQRLGRGFIRVHRNALVAAHAIRALELREGVDDEPGAEGWAVRVAPLDEWVAVSRRQVAAVRAALEEAQGRGGARAGRLRF